jgi:hypothetical protein
VSPQTTKLYDRTSDEISLDEIERTVIYSWFPDPNRRRCDLAGELQTDGLIPYARILLTGF